MIARAEILSLVPHGPNMCLIDGVQEWDERLIVCVSHNHVRPDHPLRRGGVLSAIHLIEYGAQAMAVHGALLARDKGGRSRPGMLVSARNFETDRERLDDLPGALEIHGRCELLRGDSMMHSFEARHLGVPIATGRVAVLFQDRPAA
jgi:predicted hotdog family 3-hydroxylacyl-ACP dehydratase